MNKRVLNTLLICVAIPIIFGVLSSLGSSSREVPLMFGLCFFIAGLLYILPGIILAIIKEQRLIGMGMLLSSAVLLLIGFSLCSMGNLSI